VATELPKEPSTLCTTVTGLLAYDTPLPASLPRETRTAHELDRRISPARMASAAAVATSDSLDRSRC